MKNEYGEPTQKTTLDQLLGWNAIATLRHELWACDYQILRLCMAHFRRPLTPEAMERNRRQAEYNLQHPEIDEAQDNV